MANDSYECNGDNGDGKSSIDAGALDALLQANAFFGGFIFTGLSLVSPGQQSLQGNRACDAGLDIGQNLVKYEVFSFICFLVSTVVALGFKIVLTLINCKNAEDSRQKLLKRIRKLRAGEDIHTLEMCTLRKEIRMFRKDMFRIAVALQGKNRARFRKRWVNFGVLSSALLTALGCFFLVLSMIFLFENILGLLSCGGSTIRETVGALTGVVFPVLVAYVFVIYCAYAYSFCVTD